MLSTDTAKPKNYIKKFMRASNSWKGTADAKAWFEQKGVLALIFARSFVGKLINSGCGSISNCDCHSQLLDFTVCNLLSANWYIGQHTHHVD